MFPVIFLHWISRTFFSWFLSFLDFSKVFGQHLAVRELKDAIAGFYKQKERSKPLVLSFHGTPGTGKNFIADQMVTARYKEGKSSKYVHGYSGRINFPVEADAEKYSTELQSDIFRSIRDCPHQTFIFDEVDKMPAGVFENIVDLLDHNTFLRVDMSRTIFIFISNLGGVEIANELSLLMFNGIQREKSELFHFEPILEKCAYNYEGGLKKSRSIEKAVIDYYVPFLPLEQRHVELCIRQLIANSSQSPSLNLIQ